MRKILFSFLFVFACLLSQAQGFAYVPNFYSNDVSVINLATSSVVATVAVGSRPYGVATSADGSRVYVVNQAGGTVSVINTSTNSVIATVPVGSGPFGVAVSPDGSQVYVGNNISNNLSIINTATNSVTATVATGNGPTGVAVSPDGSLVYVVDQYYNSVSIVSTATNSVILDVAVGASPYGAVVTPDGSKVYVANATDNTVSVINTATNTVMATVAVGVFPLGLAVSPDGSRVYVANDNANYVSVINTATNSVVANVNVGSSSYGVSVSPDGSKVYASVFLNSEVAIINASTNSVITTVAVGTNPTAFGNMMSVFNAPPPSGHISYAGSPFCQTGVGFVTLGAGTPGGGTFSAPAGLSINSSNGTISPAASTTGTYTVTYTHSGGSTTTSVTVIPLPKVAVGTIASVCQSDVLFKLPFTVTGSAVSYSISTDPSAPMPGFVPVINAVLPSTSTIDVAISAGSAGGSYKFIINVKNAQGCLSPGKVVFAVVVNSPLTTSITYQSPLCQTGQVLPTRTGAAGGVYSSTTGLYLNSTTGLVTPALSTPGSYTVAYTLTSSTGCTFSVSANLVITPTPKVSPGTVSSVCVGPTGATASLPYSVTSGIPVSYDISVGSVNPMPNFIPVTGAALNPNTIGVTIPTGTAAGIYSFNLYVKSAGGCVSPKYVFKVQVTGPCPIASPAYSRTINPVKNITIEESTITIAPNPIRRMLNIHTGEEGNMSVSISSSEGRMIVTNARFKSSYNFDMNGYAPGIYMVEVVNDKTGEIVRKKVVKE